MFDTIKIERLGDGLSYRVTIDGKAAYFCAGIAEIVKFLEDIGA